MPQRAVTIKYSKQAKNSRESLTQDEKDTLDALEQDLRETAGKPYNRGWKSFGSLSDKNTFHCHITYRKVAVWEIEEYEDTISVVLCRFDYIGTRANAPY